MEHTQSPKLNLSKRGLSDAFLQNLWKLQCLHPGSSSVTAVSEPRSPGGVPTVHLVIIRRLGVGAAALHHLLPSVLHHPVQVREVLQRTRGTMYNRGRIWGGCTVTYMECVSIELQTQRKKNE